MRIASLAVLAASLAAAGALAGCGGGARVDAVVARPPPHWAAARCRTQAAKVARWGQSMLVHYGGAIYPADMSYLLLRDSLRRFGDHGCAPTVLGETLTRKLTARQRRRLLSLLPAQIARRLRRAIAARRD